MKVVPEMRRAH